MKTVIAAIVVIIGLLGAVAGSYGLSLYVSHQATERICGAFAYFIRPPAPPVNTSLKQTQELQYQRLLIFEHRAGC